MNKNYDDVNIKHYLRNKIIDLIPKNWVKKHYVNILDYTINLFNTHDLGKNYYGYHNIDHELEVTYVVMSIGSNSKINDIDLKYLYVTSLLHDFDPLKIIDKPHEESVIKFLERDKDLSKMLIAAKLDFNIIKILILRTTYPWHGKLKTNAEKKIQHVFNSIGNADQIHIMELGWYLSIIDRISGYAISDFNKSMDIAKKNAHSLAWHPSLIVRNTITFFENLFNNESNMCNYILNLLPKIFQNNFFNNVFAFMKLRQKEIRIKSNYIFKNITFVSKIEKIHTRQKLDFINELLKIYIELPKPLQFNKKKFIDSIKDENIILNTLRLKNVQGQIIGFAKGGPLENYNFKKKIDDENRGLNNTIFLEPIALKMGYWGLNGGSEIRHVFTSQARNKKFKFLTSFALRQVIKTRIKNNENIQFVKLFNPERWDYYRLRL
ncbi:MAG: HD domain-containing protein [Nitrosopumilaceae archaeon]|nr:HD domain-containing protein [Nitrosopumilaceae archaeon]